MFKKIILGIGAFVSVIALSIVYVFVSAYKPAGDFKKISIGGSELLVEIADDVLEQSLGLSGRPNLSGDRGMLFLFSDLAVRNFWMINMKFPLDIIWIKEDKIVGISENVPIPAGTYAPVYSSPEPVDKVLEINSGLAKRLGISAGDSVRFD